MLVSLPLATNANGIDVAIFNKYIIITIAIYQTVLPKRQHHFHEHVPFISENSILFVRDCFSNKRPKNGNPNNVIPFQ